MEFEPIVGSGCAHCKSRILVDTDGKNCQRCGLAIHRRCGKAHRDECAGKPVLAGTSHDYGESVALEFTPRLIAMLAVGTFLSTFGIGRLAGSNGDESAQAAAEGIRGALPWIAVATGLLVAVGGLVWERYRQSNRKRLG